MFPSAKYFNICQESKKRKNKANFIRKYMKCFINFLKNKFNAVHNVIHKTFAVFGCPKVACSRDGARDFFFVIHQSIMLALSPSRADARSLISSDKSHVIRSPPIKHMKRRTLTIGI